MNYRGSYRHLLRNAKAAMLAAIEIYNKPRFDYRDECTVILLLNAWELVLKAVLSKNKKSIFYLKKRNEPHRTLTWNDAFSRAKSFFPEEIDPLPVQRNLELLSTYRDNAVHFYNKKDFSLVVYALAQTSIVNFRDLVVAIFGTDIGSDITWQLLPLGVRAPVDPIRYISGKTEGYAKEGPAVRQFLTELAAATKEVQEAGKDTGRLLTIFTVKLESIKKIEGADVVVGVEKASDASGPLAIVRTLDPNKTHPLRQMDVVGRIGTLHGQKFTPFVFQAIVWKYKVKENLRYCWQATEKILTRYSNDIVAWIRTLSASEIQTAKAGYRDFFRMKGKARKKAASEIEIPVISNG